jgi:type I restriction enzyme R subunit
MSKQPEAILEEQLVAQLQTLGYSLVTVKSESDLIHNLKQQLEKHNKFNLAKQNLKR